MLTLKSANRLKNSVSLGSVELPGSIEPPRRGTARAPGRRGQRGGEAQVVGQVEAERHGPITNKGLSISHHKHLYVRADILSYICMIVVVYSPS